MAYQKNQTVGILPIPSSVSSSQESPSTDSSTHQPTTRHIQTSIDNIDSLVQLIQQQSKDQLAAWQQTNADPAFTPESIIPKYFKEFNGDSNSMKK